MRDLLFRGRLKSSGEWDFSKFEKQDVEPYTIGQCTGLTDKNGKQIFEGDILQNDQLPYMVNGRSIYFHEVVWMDDVAAFGLYVHKNPKSRANGLSHGEMQYIDNFDPSEWEVVGNVHDNSDMLL